MFKNIVSVHYIKLFIKCQCCGYFLFKTKFSLLIINACILSHLCASQWHTKQSLIKLNGSLLLWFLSMWCICNHHFVHQHFWHKLTSHRYSLNIFICLRSLNLRFGFVTILFSFFLLYIIFFSSSEIFHLSFFLIHHSSIKSILLFFILYL